MRGHGATTIAASYLAHEAARLVGVPGERIGQWARWGHIRASVSDADPHVYAWGDVAEALAVHELLAAGIRLPVIRRAVDRIGGERPLSGGRLHVVDGRLAVERGDVLLDLFTEQVVLPLDGRIATEALLRRGGWPARELGELRVEVDPLRAGGRPCVRGRRVPVEDVVAAPGDYDLTAEEVADARAWWEAAQGA